jgi:glycosyltransferase involved in cell wall biosynthesis
MYFMKDLQKDLLLREKKLHKRILIMDEVMSKALTLLQEIKRISDRIPTDFGGGSPLPKTFLMAYIALEYDVHTYVEIGVYRGKSFFPLAYVAKIMGGKAFGIDAYDYEIAKEYEVDPSIKGDVNAFLAGLDFLQIYNDVIKMQEEMNLIDYSVVIKEDSKKAVRHFLENHIVIDMLHIDGNHDTQAVQADVDAYIPLVRDGGFIVVDDVHWESVRRVYHLLEQKYPVIFNNGYFAILYKDKAGKPILPVKKLQLDAVYSLAEVALTIEEKDRLLNEISKKATEQEQLVTSLIKHVEDQGNTILALATQLAESDRRTKALEDQFEEKERAYQTLERKAVEIEKAYQTLERKAVEIEKAYQTLNAQAVEKENQLQMLARQVQELREQVDERDRNINNLNYMISEIYKSTSWKVSRPIRLIKPLTGKLRNKVHTLTGKRKEKKSRFRPRMTTRHKKISVVVTAYNHEKYIAQCIDSILMQKGYFQLEIILGDDCSTDRTAEIMARYKISHPSLIKMMPNDTNLGVTKNLKRCLEACSGDYIAICEGDDYWLDEYKLQKQMEFLEDHPDYSMCFSGLILRYENEERLVPFEAQNKLTKGMITTADLVDENIIGNFSCCMYRSKTIKNLPKDIYDVFTVDWMFNMACGEQGPIGFLPEPMSVYRKHSQGAWTGKAELDQINILLSLLDTYDALLNHKYKDHFLKLKENLLGYRDHLLLKQPGLPIAVGDGPDRFSPTTTLDHVIPQSGSDDLESTLNRACSTDLLIADTVFPHPLSSFRFQEFISYLDHFLSSLVLTTGEHLHLFKESRGIKEIIGVFESEYPEYTGRTLVSNHDFDRYNAKLGYAIFLDNVYQFLNSFEREKIPFVFTLYPGGGFAIHVPESDAKLSRVFRSPQFRKVIVTQKITYDYLLEKKFCSPKQIEFIYGVVTPLKILKNYENKKFYGFDKGTLDICFVAHKYMKAGIDKGYDIFIATARQLALEIGDIHFHVVGNFDATDIPIDGLEDKLTFYGQKNPSWFDDFYQDKDIILSPNKPFILLPGSFDGFPTASCTEAGLRKVAIFCTDELKMNIRFTDRKDIVIIPPNASKIVNTIKYYHAHPAELKTIAENGCRRIQELYGYENQIAPRIRILEEEMKDRN